jgi:hypothetical protein
MAAWVKTTTGMVISRVRDKRPASFHVLEFNLKDEGCVARDNGRVAARPVGLIWRNAENPLTADLNQGIRYEETGSQARQANGHVATNTDVIQRREWIMVNVMQGRKATNFGVIQRRKNIEVRVKNERVSR